MDPFEEFWHASSLNRVTAGPFGRGVNDYVDVAAPRWLTMPDQRALPRPDDRLLRTMAARASERSFSAQPVGWAQLGGLLAGLGPKALGAPASAGRLYPSAGALYPIEAICLVDAVDGCDRGAYVYNADDHSLSPLVPLPVALDAPSLFAGVEQMPPVVVVLTIDVGAMIAKYGQRGGRFALIEVGHAAQNLALRAVVEGLVGYELGGSMDAELLGLLGLAETDARIALAVGFGRPERPTRRDRRTLFSRRPRAPFCC